MKADAGRFFEDFGLGEEIRHAVPRTLGEADAAIYTSLTGSRFPVNCAAPVARSIGLPGVPFDDLLVFHIVFGRTVPDISRNAIANLGYADGRFLAFVFPGDTLSATSTVIGLKETSNRQAGVVHVRTMGTNQRGEAVLDFVRWALVRKRSEGSRAPVPVVPDLPSSVSPARLHVPTGLDTKGYDTAASGSAYPWDDYAAGERIDHVDGMTIEESCHMTAARLYQNNAKVHFNQFAEASGRHGRRIVYGGHVISIARALSCNGLANAFRIAAINGGRHVNPCFAGDTIHAWSEVVEKLELPGRQDFGALRLRTVATRDRPCHDFPDKAPGGAPDPAVVLDLDYTVIMPRRLG